MRGCGKQGRIIVGGLFFLAHTLLTGCDDAPPPQDMPPRPFEGTDAGRPAERPRGGVMTELVEMGPREYKIAKEYPSNVTGVVVRRRDGAQEIIPESKVPEIMQNTGGEGLLGMGTVLSAGLLGYMMGKNTSLNPFVYANDAVYQQSLARRNFLEEQQKEEERRGTFRGFWYGGRTYTYGGSRAGRTTPTGTARTGFFSRLTSSLHGFSS